MNANAMRSPRGSLDVVGHFLEITQGRRRKNQVRHPSSRGAQACFDAGEHFFRGNCLAPVQLGYALFNQGLCPRKVIAVALQAINRLGDGFLKRRKATRGNLPAQPVLMLFGQLYAHAGILGSRLN